MSTREKEVIEILRACVERYANYGNWWSLNHLQLTVFHSDDLPDENLGMSFATEALRKVREIENGDDT